MDSYTITIAPNDDSGASTTLIVDTSGEQVRVTDVHLRAVGGLTDGQMPAVDLGLLLRAVAAPIVGPAHIEATADNAPVSDAAIPAPVVDEAATTSETQPPAATATTPKTRRTKATPVTDPTPEPAARPRARRSTAAATAAAKATNSGVKGGRATGTARTKPSTKATAPGGRVYRRTPEDLGAVYQQAKTAAAVADHYGVPQHTAQGWIRRVKATDTATTGS
jgi:hypothetical protein